MAVARGRARCRQAAGREERAHESVARGRVPEEPGAGLGAVPLLPPRAAVTGSCPPGPDQPRSPLHPAEEQRRPLGSGRQRRRHHQRPRGLLHDPPARPRSDSPGRAVRAPSLGQDRPAAPRASAFPRPSPRPCASVWHPRAPCPSSHSEALPSRSLRLPPEGFLPLPACPQDPTWKMGASSGSSRFPLLWGTIMAGGAAHPSLSRQVQPAWLPLPCSNEDTALPQHGVKVLFLSPASWLPRGSSPHNPCRAGAPSWSSAGMVTG